MHGGSTDQLKYLTKLNYLDTFIFKSDGTLKGILPPAHTNVEGHRDMRRPSDSTTGTIQGEKIISTIYLGF